MSQQIYLHQLVDRLVEEWKPPDRRPVPEEPSGSLIPRDALRTVLDSVFFASLRTEEGHHHGLALVLVNTLQQLTELRRPWRVHRLAVPLNLDTDRLTKLAPTLKGGRRFFIVQSDGVTPSIVGLGEAPEGAWYLFEDKYPRIQVVGPGDMVFYRGDGALFRYRAGAVDELRPDFFASGEEPADAMDGIGLRLFKDWPNAEGQFFDDVVASSLSDVIERVAQIGHGGMLAILAPDESSDELRNACSYQIDPLDLGASIVHSHEGSLIMSQIDQRLMGPAPDYAPMRAMSNDELDQEAESRDARNTVESHSRTIAGMAAVDGAVLLTQELVVLGFGCKLPGLEGPPPRVYHAPSSPGDELSVYDLTMRGTRHTAAALFAAGRDGRMAFTISADGPTACFMWSPRHKAVLHWPVHVGAFALRRR